MNAAELRHGLSMMARQASGQAEKDRAELCRRARASFFIDQTEVSEDTNTFVGVRCPRQVGKTYWAATEALCTMNELDEAHCLYITMIRDQAERNFWEPVQRIAELHGFVIETNETDLRITAPATGSWLILRGCEDERAAATFEGTYYDRVFIDESQEFRPKVLDKLVNKSLMPCLAFRSGRVFLMGRPVGVFNGMFFDVTGPFADLITTGEDGQRRATARPWSDRHDQKWENTIYAWSTHYWSQENNTKQPQIWRASLEFKRIMNWSDNHPTWLREYKGQWAMDGGLLRYYIVDRLADVGVLGGDPAKRTDGTLWRPNEKRTEKNPFGVPVPEGTPLRYVIGADAGGVDPYTISVTAYSPHYPIAFEACHEFEEAKIGLRVFAYELAKAIAYCAGWDGDEGELIEPPRALQGLPPGMKYGKRLLEYAAKGEDVVDDIWVDIDKMGQEIVTMMAADYYVTLKPAKKLSKLAHQEALNTDAADRRALCREGSRLAEERKTLAKDETGLKDKPGMKNNNCDAALYATTNARHHDAREIRVVPAVTPSEKSELVMRSHLRTLSPDELYADIGNLAPIDEWEGSE